LCYLKPQSSWKFVTAAKENQSLTVSFTVAVIKSEQNDKNWVNSEAHKLAGKEIFLHILHITETFRTCFFLSTMSVSYHLRNQHAFYVIYGKLEDIGCHRVFPFKN
jgi:hypothetical protein